MPPSPRLKIALNETRYAELCSEMGLTVRPPCAFKDRLPRGAKTTVSGGACYGVYQPLGGNVTIFTEQREYDFNRLRAVNAELVITLLHELRHAWQHERGHLKEWSVIRQERDAESFAQENYHKWRGVIQLRRQTFHRKLPG